MILGALNDYYYRLVERQEEGISPYGYSMEKISYAIVLNAEGVVVDVNDLRDHSGKKPVPKLLSVPAPFKRTSGVQSFYLWDKSSYVLGLKREGKDEVASSPVTHAAFRELHERVLDGTDDPGLKALLAFLAAWKTEQFQASSVYSRHARYEFCISFGRLSGIFTPSRGCSAHLGQAAQKCRGN